MPSRFLKETGWSLVKLEDEQKVQSVLDDATRFAPELQKWRAPRIEVSQRSLPFYPDYVLTLLQDPRSNGHALWGLYTPGDFWPLDASERAIDWLDRVAPLTDPENAEYRQLRGAAKELPAPVPRVQPVLDLSRWALLENDSDEAKPILNALNWSEADRHGASEILLRRAETPFYRKHHLYELLLRRNAAMNTYHQFYFLYQSGSLLPLYGHSSPIHQANANENPTFDNPDSVMRYLRFFCTAIRSDFGRFVLVERLREVPWREAPSPELGKAVEDAAIPIEVELAAPKSKWNAVATLLYGNSLFRARFSIEQSGMVSMSEDKPVVGGISALDLKPGKLTGTSQLMSPSESQTYLDSRLPAASDGAVDECDAKQFISLIEQAATAEVGRG